MPETWHCSQGCRNWGKVGIGGNVRPFFKRMNIALFRRGKYSALVPANTGGIFKCFILSIVCRLM